MDKEFTVYEHVNKINGKRYIGYTGRKPTSRWGEKGQYYRKDRNPFFFNAIQKYGWDNFEHNIIQTNLSFEEATKLEKFLIEQYQTTDRTKGYNITLGGEGHRIYDYDLIMDLFNQGLNQKQIIEKTGASPPTVAMALEIKGITQEQKNSRGKDHVKKKVGQYDDNDNLIAIYESVAKAAEQFNKESAATHIARVCRGERKHTLGFKWRYIDV